MPRRTRPILLLLCLLALAPVLAACGSADEQGGPSTIPSTTSAEPIDLDGRFTTLTLDPQTAGVLGDNEIDVSFARPATLGLAGLKFPVSGGRIDPDDLHGTIRHRGGIVLARGPLEVPITALIIDTTKGQVSGVVGGRRIPVLNLDESKIDRGEGRQGELLASNIGAQLTVAAANALNEALGVSTFEASLPMGIVSLDLTGS